MIVGFFGDGVLNIEDGGVVNAGEAYIGRHTGSTGLARVVGASSVWNASGVMRIALDNADATGAPGTLALRQGGRVNPTMLRIGVLGALTGDGTVEANVESNGLVAPGTPDTPGDTLTIAGQYTQQSQGVFRVVFDESADHGVLQATGSATLAGALEVVVDMDAPPAPGMYTVLTASGVGGTFATSSFPTLPGGGTFSVSYTPTSVVLTVEGGVPPECPGDTNGDGVVDFDDLGAVLGQFGLSGPDLTGDLNNDGVVNFDDLGILLGNFGTHCD